MRNDDMKRIFMLSEFIIYVLMSKQSNAVCSKGQYGINVYKRTVGRLGRDIYSQFWIQIWLDASI